MFWNGDIINDILILDRDAIYVLVIRTYYSKQSKSDDIIDVYLFIYWYGI